MRCGAGVAALLTTTVTAAGAPPLKQQTCNAHAMTGTIWTSSWWRAPNQHPPAQYVYTFTALNATHFSVTSTSSAPPGAWWHKGPAVGVLAGDFATSGR